MFRVKSIFLKLFFTYIAILIAFFLVFNSVSYWLFEKEFTMSRQSLVDRQVNRAIKYIQLASDKGLDRETLISAVELSIDRQDRVFFIYDKNGKFLYRIGQLEIPVHVDQAVIDKVVNGDKVVRRINPNEGEEKMFLIGESISDTVLGQEKAVIMITYGIEKDIRQIRYLQLLGITISIIVSGLFILFLSKKITDPLRQMNQIALKVANGQFNQRVDIKSRDELGQLGKTFNYMAEELSSLDQMRKDFVANVSHDLRTPLTSINGFIDALLDGTIPVNKQEHYFKIMRDQTERLVKLVSDLLDIAKLEAKQIHITKVNFNLLEQVRQLIARMEPTLNKNHISVQLISEEEHEIIVFADPDRINQVMSNLIQNAIQFSPANETIEITLSTQKTSAIFSIQDHGPGIQENELKYIWERFYKTDKARSKQSGTGIGLSIVKHILDIHQTTIEVDSKLGEGTKFTFYLPLAKRK